MTSEMGVIDRLRAANPANAVTIDAPELWLEITSSPGDARLDASPARSTRVRRWRQRAGAHRGALLACGVFVAACGTAGMAGVTGVINFGVFAHDKPLQLFRADPAWAPDRHPEIVASSVRLIETVSVPTVGRVEYWVARTVNGWRCAAFRLSDGVWAGTAGASSSRYGLSGPVPGFRGPWITWEGPDFRYEQIELGGRPYRHDGVATYAPYGVVYGTVQTTGVPTEVRDLVSGASAFVVQGRYFVLIIPPRLYLFRNSAVGLPAGSPRDAKGYYIPYLHIEALDASGRRLVVAPVDHATFGP